jgi:hypothetical protein
MHAEADHLIRAIYQGEVSWAARERAEQQKLGAAFGTVRTDAAASAALHRLVYGLKGRTCLLAIAPFVPVLGPQPGNTGLDALLHFARFSDRWLREPETWVSDASDARWQASSLARHLFACYPMPAFLDAAWALGFDGYGEQYREWFVHLASGGKLEAVAFPLPMTHKAAHFFLKAPNRFTIPAAMRFGQIRALGGSEALAHALAETFLSDVQPDEDFWLSVTHFLVNHPELPLSQVGPVVDFVRSCKFGSSGDATEPHFAMKGRTLEALLRRMDEWHETLARLGKKARQSWSLSGIAPLDRTEQDRLSTATCHWRIVEITESIALAEEGQTMRHCVRSYQDACVKGQTSIWSLRLRLSDDRTVRRLFTIEVNNHRRAVVQVRGKCNRMLSSLRGNKRMMYARDILREWAREQHLGIACSL